MRHAKFQSPSIYIDRYFQLCDWVTQSPTQSLSDRVTCRALHLARGQGWRQKISIVGLTEHTRGHTHARTWVNLKLSQLCWVGQLKTLRLISSLEGICLENPFHQITNYGRQMLILGAFKSWRKTFEEDKYTKFFLVLVLGHRVGSNTLITAQWAHIWSIGNDQETNMDLERWGCQVEPNFSKVVSQLSDR